MFRFKSTPQSADDLRTALRYPRVSPARSRNRAAHDAPPQSASPSRPRRSRFSSSDSFACAGVATFRRTAGSGSSRSAAAELLLFRGVEPVATYFTPIAWSAWILIADAAVLAITGRSRLNDAPITLARMAVLSIPLWLIFEAYNLRLRNWTYVGVPPAGPAFLGYGGLSPPSRRRFSRRPTSCRRCCRRCPRSRAKFRRLPKAR